MIKRYGLFGGHFYYASGGFTDLLHSYDTLDEAVAVATNPVEKGQFMQFNAHGPLDWWHVFDFDERRVVAHGLDHGVDFGGHGSDGKHIICPTAISD